MGNTHLISNEKFFRDIVENFRKDLLGVRTGRAHEALVENIDILAYGNKMKILELASITVPDPRQIVIQPWDVSLIKDMEKGILESELSLQPIIDGNKLRINVPQLTQDRREELCKVVRQKHEEAKTDVRRLREKIKELIEKDFKNKIIREDDKFRFIEELDKKVSSVNEEIKEMSLNKEEDVKNI